MELFDRTTKPSSAKILDVESLRLACFDEDYELYNFSDAKADAYEIGPFDS